MLKIKTENPENKEKVVVQTPAGSIADNTQPVVPVQQQPPQQQGKGMPDGLWVKCKKCEEIIYNKELEDNLKVCPKCGYYFRMKAHERIKMLADEGTFKEYDPDIMPVDILNFLSYPEKKPYADKLKSEQKKTGLNEAVVTGECELSGVKVGIGVLDFYFQGGSMGSVMGEKIARLVEKSILKKMPVVIVSASGGARMQEGILSLMQMAKTSAAIGNLSRHKLPYISVMVDPTSGGVTASFAMLGDVNIGEPGAFIGFAGPVVIEQTIRQKLPPGFQSAEFSLEHGLVDIIIPRKELKAALHRLLGYMLAKPVAKQ
ncbi:MAG: acetyl-CoA carboxylase, carboxyltransferase subunit beta [Elusimicrobiota bacterium]